MDSLSEEKILAYVVRLVNENERTRDLSIVGLELRLIWAPDGVHIHILHPAGEIRTILGQVTSGYRAYTGEISQN